MCSYRINYTATVKGADGGQLQINSHINCGTNSTGYLNKKKTPINGSLFLCLLVVLFVSRIKTFGYFTPVYYVPESRKVIRAFILVFQVVSMFPNITT